MAKVATVPLAHTTLRPPWLFLARAGWILFALICVTLFVLGTIATLREPLPSCASPNANCLANTQITREDVEVADRMGFPFFLPLTLGFSLAARMSLGLVGVILFWRKSDDWVAMLISGALMSVLLEGVQGINESLIAIQNFAFGIGTALFLPIPFIFPTGRFEPRWMRWPVLALAIPYTLLVIFPLEAIGYANLIAVASLLWIGLSAYSLPYRYFKVASPAERQQIKWVLLGMCATFGTSLYYVIATNLFPFTQPSEGRIVVTVINGPLYLGGYGFFAFSFMFAITRYRLWDIDVLIRRTLQYTILTGLLALTYFGGVVILQEILSPLTGSPNAPFVTVITTLGIAALFNPLRVRVQDFIDRRFYRRKYNAELALAQFATLARDEVDMDKLSSALIGVVEETMQPETISLWIRQK